MMSYIHCEYLRDKDEDENLSIVTFFEHAIDLRSSKTSECVIHAHPRVLHVTIEKMQFDQTIIF